MYSLSVNVLISLCVGEFCAERYLSMSKDEKRELYACGTKYVTLEEVSTWQKHVSEQSVRCVYPSGDR